MTRAPRSKPRPTCRQETWLSQPRRRPGGRRALHFSLELSEFLNRLLHGWSLDLLEVRNLHLTCSPNCPTILPAAISSQRIQEIHCSCPSDVGKTRQGDQGEVPCTLPVHASPWRTLPLHLLHLKPFQIHKTNGKEHVKSAPMTFLQKLNLKQLEALVALDVAVPSAAAPRVIQAIRSALFIAGAIVSIEPSVARARRVAQDVGPKIGLHKPSHSTHSPLGTAATWLKESSG